VEINVNYFVVKLWHREKIVLKKLIEISKDKERYFSNDGGFSFCSFCLGANI